MMLYACMDVWSQILVSQNRPKHHSQSICMCACFDFVQKFGQGLILELLKILLHNHLTIWHTCMAPKSGWQTPKIAPATAKTVFCVKLAHQNCNISCLCSNVWRKCNVKITYNIIVQSFDKCPYLHVLQVLEVNAKTCMRHVDANCVPKTNPHRPE